MAGEIKCPYCLLSVLPKEGQKGGLSLFTCPDCGTELHREYITRSGVASYSVGFVGFPGHGKTVYLTSLFYTLGQMQNVWPNFFFKSLDDHSHQLLYSQVAEFGGNPGKLPEKTPETFNSPALVLFNNTVDVGDCCLSFYDVSGETYSDSGKAISDRGKVVAKSDTVLFLMSLAASTGGGFSQSWTFDLQKMLDCYLHAAQNRMSLNLKRNQDLVVVLTKGDLLLTNSGFKDTFGPDLMRGSYDRYRSLVEASKEVSDLSNRIKKWLHDNGAAGFINMAQGSFRSVTYTLVSATGGRTDGQVITAAISPSDPRRVLDPLIRILQKEVCAAETIIKKKVKDARDEELWKRIDKATDKVRAIREYLKAMPDGKYSQRARRYLFVKRLLPFIKALSLIYLLYLVVVSSIAGVSALLKNEGVPTAMLGKSSVYRLMPWRKPFGEYLMVRLADSGNADAEFYMSLSNKTSFNENLEHLERKLAALAPGERLSQDDYNTFKELQSRKAKWLSDAAAQGHSWAQLYLSRAYLEGNLVPKDLGEASRLLEASVAKGNYEAESELGRWYLSGIRFERDVNKARDWFEKAASHGSANGKYNLALLLLEQTGAEKERGLELLKSLADDGLAEAENVVGVLYWKGKDVVQDYQKAATYFVKAAAQGNPAGQSNLGFAYLEGHGVPKNTASAITQFRKAARQGNQQAQDKLKEMGETF